MAEGGMTGGPKGAGEDRAALADLRARDDGRLPQIGPPLALLTVVAATALVVMLFLLAQRQDQQTYETSRSTVSDALQAAERHLISVARQHPVMLASIDRPSPPGGQAAAPASDAAVARHASHFGLTGSVRVPPGAAPQRLHDGRAVTHAGLLVDAVRSARHGGGNTDGDTPAGAGVVLVDGAPALAAAVVLTPHGALPPPTERDVLLVVQSLAPGGLERLGFTHAGRNMRLLPPDQAPQDLPFLTLTAPDGVVLGHLVWEVERPGRMLLVDALPTFAGILLLLTILAATVYRRITAHGSALARTAAELIDSETRYRAAAEQSDRLRALLVDAVESIDEGFVLFDADGRLVACNDRYRRAYPAVADLLDPGSTFEEILRVAAERLGVAGDASPVDLRQWVAERLNRHMEFKAHVEAKLSDGHWYRISERPTRSGGVVKVLSDITATKRHEQELAQKTELLEATFDAMAQGVAVFDADGRVVAWNDHFAQIMGYPPEMVEQGADLDSFRAFDRNRACTPLPSPDIFADAREALEVSLPHGRAAEIRVGALAGGGFVATFTDITARKAAEQALQHSQKMDAVGQLAGGIAHEFNNMLTSIGGFARMAQRHPSDVGRVETCLGEVTRAADRAAALTKQLLNFSRRDAEDSVRPLRLKDLIRELGSFLPPLLGERIDFTTSISDPDLVVNADQAKLHQAVVNLCINARDAMPAGGEITLAVGVSEPDAAFRERHPKATAPRFATVRVADTGTGIAPEIIGRIFEPFFTTKEQGKGTGLGLPMVYGTVDQLDGAVEVSSRPGEGAVFTLYLPLLQTPGRTAVDLPAQVHVDGSGYTILLAEDEDSVRRFVTMTLEDAGFLVLTAVDGQEALERFEESLGSVDLVLTDVVMPGIDGPELARRLRQEATDVKILFMSGYNSDRDGQRLVDVPATGFLGKPVDPDVLLGAVRDALALPCSPGLEPLS